MKYRKKPIVVEAVRWTGENVGEINGFCNPVKEYLAKHDIVVDDVMKEKPPAIVYIDDRAICFDGNPHGLLDKITAFEPWTAKAMRRMKNDD